MVVCFLEVTIVSIRASLAARDKGATGYGKKLPCRARLQTLEMVKNESNHLRWLTNTRLLITDLLTD